MSGWTKAWFFNATAKPVMVVGCCFGGRTLGSALACKIKGKAGILTRILERDARLVVVYGSTSWSFSIAIAKSTGMAVRRDEQCQVQSSSWEFSNLSCIFSIQCFHHLMVLCCCWILQRAYSHIVGWTPRLGYGESLPDQSAARKTKRSKIGQPWMRCVSQKVSAV